jgi:hypothetical protein
MELTGANWRKARRSAGNGGECVEVACLPGAVAVRDSKDPHGPKLAFSRDAWRTFAGRVKTDTL